jgi:hypothetical protein
MGIKTVSYRRTWIREVALTGMQLDGHQRCNQAGLQQHLLDGIDLL